MRDAYIVQSVRTPGCKQKRGLFNQTRPDLTILMMSWSAAPSLKQNRDSTLAGLHPKWPDFRKKYPGQLLTDSAPRALKPLPLHPQESRWGGQMLPWVRVLNP